MTPTPQHADAPLADLLSPLVGAVAARQLAALASPLDLARPGRTGGAALVALSAEARGRLDAAVGLARRFSRARLAERVRVASPEEAVALVRPLLGMEAVEVVVCLLLDARHRYLDHAEVSRGTLSQSLVHPREVFRPALAVGAGAILLVHNHPSGDPEPSADDHEVTRRIAASGELLGIPLLDHVVVGAHRSVSLRARCARLFAPRVACARSRAAEAGPAREHG